LREGYREMTDKLPMGGGRRRILRVMYGVRVGLIIGKDLFVLLFGIAEAFHFQIPTL
jgi:hypothetical protein